MPEYTIRRRIDPVAILFVAVFIAFITFVGLFIYADYTEQSRVDSLCIDGVEYLSFHNGVTAHFKADGSVFTCQK